MRVLGFSSKARHGKDTCSHIAMDLAKSEYGEQWVQWALAYPLKAMVLGRGQGKYTVEDVFETKPPEVRDLLQQVGTEQGRHVYGDEIWTLQSEAHLYIIQQHFPHNLIQGVVFSDVRFQNEVQFIQNGGHSNSSKVRLRDRGIALWVESNRPTLKGEFARHASETAFDHVSKDTFFDGVITNDCSTSLDDLRNQIRPFVEMLM